MKGARGNPSCFPVFLPCNIHPANILSQSDGKLKEQTGCKGSCLSPRSPSQSQRKPNKIGIRKQNHQAAIAASAAKPRALRVRPKAGKNLPGTGVEAERQTRSTQKHSAESPGHFSLGAKQTSSGARGAAWLQRKHRPNVAFPDVLLLAPAIAHHEDGSLGSQESIALPNWGSSPPRCSAPAPCGAHAR